MLKNHRNISLTQNSSEGKSPLRFRTHQGESRLGSRLPGQERCGNSQSPRRPDPSLQRQQYFTETQTYGKHLLTPPEVLTHSLCCENSAGVSKLLLMHAQMHNMN
ncbi:hypothetical protein ATANTOWER_018647 [Ataeniobius toweri]|uniref:Uncharacterized protein n=1 Tax=Ataeniobius toweri TaxID=208326 RepID=A0ABU7AHZ7_9TELE|nr:hypothetical protein [Ataeniobius toweri]